MVLCNVLVQICQPEQYGASQTYGLQNKQINHGIDERTHFNSEDHHDFQIPANAFYKEQLVVALNFQQWNV